jgi:hypothetical protein
LPLARLQLPVKPALVHVIVADDAVPLNDPEHPAVWLMLNVIVPVNVLGSTVPFTLPAIPFVPDCEAHVPVTVVVVWLSVMNRATGA